VRCVGLSFVVEKGDTLALRPLHLGMGSIRLHLFVSFLALHSWLCCCSKGRSVSEDCDQCVEDFKEAGGCKLLKEADAAEVDKLVKPNCSTCGIRVFLACDMHSVMDKLSDDDVASTESLWEQAAYVAAGTLPSDACTSSEDVEKDSCPAVADELPDVVELNCSAGAVTAKTLLGPLHDTFHATYWQRRPVFIKRRDSAGRLCNGTFDEIFNTDFLELFPHVFETSERREKIELQRFSDGDEFERLIDNYPNIFIAYLAGVSIVFNQFDLIWPHAAHFCREMNKVLPNMVPKGLAPLMNMYITPPGQNQVFGLHNDAQDVMILQLSGKKTWRVQYNRTRRFKGLERLGTEERDHPALQAVLEPGDFLYIPRLHKHEAFTDNTSHSTSISLTIPYFNSNKDRHSGKMNSKYQKKLLKSHPLPTGMRTGPYTLRSKIALHGGKCAGCDNVTLMKDVAASIKANVPSRDHRKRSLSKRVIEGIVTALMGARQGPESQVECGSLQTPSVYERGSDNFGKLAIAGVLNWLKYGILER